jgi:hypothetical protein
MFEQMLARRRLRAAAKLYARHLGPQLIHDYGASEHYTWAQVRASVEDYNAFKRQMAAYKPKRQPAWGPESAGSLPASSGEF